MRRSSRFLWGLLLVCVVVVTACDSRSQAPNPKAGAVAGGASGVGASGVGAISLVDATDAAGVQVQHHNGATEERYLPETMGAGVAIFDADGDRRADIFLVGGLAVADLGHPSAAGRSTLWLARDGGTFVDATPGSGLDSPRLGMGVAVGDVDNDGDLDLAITGVGGDQLLRNRGDATFEDLTAESGLGAAAGEETFSFSSSAAFLDYDRDGWLDLFIGRYVTWSPETDLPCLPDGVHRSYCTPEAYPGASNRLYRNLGKGRFKDVTVETGLERTEGKTLGVAVIDLDGDLWPDLVVANDTIRNFLFRNLGNGRFEEVGLGFGVALGQSGAPRGAMGIDVADLDGDLAPEIVIGNFAQEMSAVYRFAEGGVYVDEAARWGVGLPTLMSLAFGVQILDLDLDGHPDLVFANGHIEPEIERFQALQTHAQPPAVFRNLGAAEFVQVGEESMPSDPLVARGLASGDLDGDGDLDLVVTQNGGSARVWRNDSPRGHFLRLQLEGRASNRSGYGARVDVEAGGQVFRRWLTSGRSYLSASEPVLTFGLGEQDKVDVVRVTWPSGVLQEVRGLDVDRLHWIQEPEVNGTPAR